MEKVTVATEAEKERLRSWPGSWIQSRPFWTCKNKCRLHCGIDRQVRWIQKPARSSPPPISFRDYSLTEPLTGKFGIPAYLENDGMWQPSASGCSVPGKAVPMSLPDGFHRSGGGAVLNGRPYSGATSNAMEIGHMTIDPHSKHRCNCGNYGDLNPGPPGPPLRSGPMKPSPGKATGLASMTPLLPGRFTGNT